MKPGTYLDVGQLAGKRVTCPVAKPKMLLQNRRRMSWGCSTVRSQGQVDSQKDTGVKAVPFHRIIMLWHIAFVGHVLLGVL